MSFKRAFFTIGGFTLLSRCTGFVRDLMAANVLGAGMAADAFFVALRLPNLFRRLFAEGAFTISFVPLFSAALKDSQSEARQFAEEALAMLMVALLPFTLFMMLIMPWFMHIITPGYASDPVKFALAVDLSQITFPYLMLISLSSLLGSILNAIGRFAPYAAAPIAFNLIQIVALLGWNENEIVAAHAQAWAITISGAVQLLWLAISAWRAGWAIRWRLPRMTERVRRLLRLIGPGALGGGVMQVNIFIDMVLASLLPAGAVSYLAYADRLYQLPVGVIGIAIGTALLPSLSRTVREGIAGKAIGEQNRAIEFGLYLGLPSAVGLALLAEPILAVMYERGAFTAEASHFTAWAVAAYALAIPAYMISKVLTVAFYAREDTKSPFLISLRTVVVNTIAAFCFIQLFTHMGYLTIAHAGIALATALTAWLNVLLLAQRLKSHGHFAVDATLLARSLRIVASAATMGVALWLMAGALQPYFRGHAVYIEVAALSFAVAAGAIIYFGMAHVTGAQRLDEVARLLRRRSKDTGAPPPEAAEG